MSISFLRHLQNAPNFPFDMIFCIRQLQEKRVEQDRLLYIVFVDFSKAFNAVGRTVYIQSRQITDLFNVAHFRAKIKTTGILMRELTRELLFADDSALVAHSAEEIQKIVDAFSDASK